LLTLHSEKQSLTEEANRIIKTIKQLETSLSDPNDYDQAYAPSSSLKITTPLLPCVESLKEKLIAVTDLHRERFEEVKSMFI
jgi:protein regulator of cytokinesis 1